MRRPRRSSSTGVDLIGFLDILSAVMVIVLLVISVLALSIGEQGTTQAAPEPLPAAASESRTAPALVEITTVGGRDVTAATSFLLCKGESLEQFDPGNGERIKSWSLGTTSAAAVARELAAPNVYLAVSGSCFPSLDSLVEAFRASGSQLGYEPTSEEAVLPWQ
ncbi:hypothetical protein [Synechococcus sp. 1G10]|uniref:hypothetical protein n=1 Tax=Synechococcus sp. 1G10 TaxID=2025605 RepID=UPI00117CFB8C|nr:hypothetical protein [Synechococcus sp. 1G10]